jgi:hypothetical protein
MLRQNGEDSTVLWYDSRKQRNRERFDAWAARGLDEAPLTIPIQAIRELQASIQGTVLLPGDKGYQQATHLANPRFEFHPELIVLCAGMADVGTCMGVINEFDISFAVRSGGHSTAGYSGNNVMMLDVSALNGVHLIPENRLALVGPGCTWGDFNNAVEAFRFHLPGGACPDVCQGGYMQGGGYGFTARIFGMNCDQPSWLLVMLADGSYVKASATINADLFWAMCGGTGNNFGILLQTVYPLQEGDEFLGFSVCWDMTTPSGRTDASQSLSWLQDNFVRTVPSELGFQMVWVFEGPVNEQPTPTFRLMGMYDGTQPDLEALLAPLLAQPGATLQYYTGKMKYSALNEYLLTKPYDVPEFPPNINPNPPCENKVSRYVTQTLQPSEWLTLIEYFVSSPNPYTTVAFEAYRGTIADKPQTFNAFVHRNVDFDCFMDVFWLKPEDEPVMEGYLQGWKSAIAPFWTGQVYQNYPSEGDTDFATEYWGSVLYPTLRYIKYKYDPNNRFRFPQSIPPLELQADLQDDAAEFIHPAIREPISYL